MNISRITPTLNNQNKLANYSRKNINFGALPVKEAGKSAGAIERGIEKFYLSLIKSEPFTKMIEKIDISQEAKIDKIKKYNENIKDKDKAKKFESFLFANLIVIGSTILSGFYVIKTINNKKLDEKKRRTLAINQAAVWVASTVMAYTIDGKLNKYTTKVKDDFKKLNNIPAIMKDAAKVEKMNKHVEGISKAKGIIAIDTIYRFLAPVAMTPIANYIGNKLNEDK